ncbi:ABC transporter ATP-binding protein [Paraconexibacter sp.]|uniref:ABC transporter ATP-binding protein n=1 Tax=Paraconexibacter sp. TaxID=2949640 RepID=UPI003561E7E1
MTAAPIVTLEHVTRSYTLGEVTVTALADVSLEILPGEFTVILGPSGCGKTTLLNMIGALDTPTSGRLLVAGRDLTGAGRKERFRFRRETIGFIFQTFNLFPALTAAENVEFGIDVAGVDGGHELAVSTLEQVGLAERVRHFPHELSGGEQQRVAIARALATGSPVLLADEPTGELDFTTGVQILGLLHQQAHEGRCVLVVTHNREIARAAHRVIELSSGRIVSDGPPAGGTVDLTRLRW